MAKEDIVFKVSVDEKGKSLSDLKKEFRDIQAEVSNATKGTEQYYQSLQKLANVKDEMEDLREEITGLQGAGRFQAFGNVASSIAGGFQAATAAAALFGVQSDEVEKTLLKVQAAMAFTQGIQSLEGLSQAFTVVGTVIKTQVVTALTTLKGALIATGIGAAVVALGALIYAANEYNDAVEESFERQRKFNEELKKTTEAYDKTAEATERARNAQKGGVNDLEREIKVLEASGASYKTIYEKRLELIDKEVYNLKVRRNTIEGNSELELKYSEQIKDKETERLVLTAQYEKQLREERKKAADEREAERKKNQVDYEPLEEIDAIKAIGDARDEEEAKRLKFLKDYEAETQRINEAQLKIDEDKARKAQEQRDKELQAERQLQEAKLQLASASISSVQMLSDTYFQNQLLAVKGNVAKENEIRKKQFELDKAFSIARAAIDGYRSVTGALAQTAVLGPAAPILAAANGILAAATIAKIAATKFDAGNTNNSFGLPNTGTATPQVQTNTSANTPVRNDVTFLDQNGNNLSQVYVTETDISKAQNRIKRIKTQARY